MDRPPEGIAAAPAWLLRLLDPTEERQTQDPAGEVDSPGAIRRAEAFLRETSPAVEGRGGNNRTFQTAAILRSRFGLSEDKARALMWGVFNPRCEPPWDPEELDEIVANAYRYAKRAPGSEGVREEALNEMLQGLDDDDEPGENDDELWPYLDVDGLLALPPPTWAIEETIGEKTLSLLYGPFGAYKSFLALDMALALCTSSPWAGRARQQEQTYRVLYVAGEGAPGVQRRLRAWCKHRDIEYGELGNFFLSAAMPLFQDDDMVRRLSRTIARLGIDFVFLDTVSHALAGLDENSTADMGIFVARCRELQEKCHTGIVGIHHTGKDESKGARGATNLPAACDTVLRVRKAAARQALVDMEKQKDAEPWSEPQGFEGYTVLLGETPDGKMEKSLVFEPSTVSSVEAAVQESRLAVARQELKALEPGGEPIQTATLARRIASHFKADSASRELVDWTRRTLPRALPEYVATWNEKRNRALSWTNPHPKETEEPDDDR